MDSPFKRKNYVISSTTVCKHLFQQKLTIINAGSICVETIAKFEVLWRCAPCYHILKHYTSMIAKSSAMRKYNQTCYTNSNVYFAIMLHKVVMLRCITADIQLMPRTLMSKGQMEDIETLIKVIPCSVSGFK